MQKSTCAYSYPTSSTSRYPSGPTTSSAFSPSANPNEDWTKISDLAERRRIQNRIAQRNYRKKLKRRLEDLERRAASPPSPQSYSDLGQLDGDFSGESWDQHLTENLAVRGPKRRQMTPESLSPGHSPAPSSTDEQQSQEYKPHFSTSPPTYAYSTYLLHDPTIYPPCPHHASQFGADPRTSGEVPFGSRYMTSSEPFHQTDLYKSNPSMMDADSLSPFNMNYAMLAGTEAQTSHSHTPALSDCFDHSLGGSPSDTAFLFPPTPASIPASPLLHLLTGSRKAAWQMFQKCRKQKQAPISRPGSEEAMATSLATTGLVEVASGRRDELQRKGPSTPDERRRAIGTVRPRPGTDELAPGGGPEPWKADDWVASDDRVRGGSSQSYLDCAASGQNACFHGNLDIETLGGAGFASQRTTREDRSWDFSGYDGLEIVVSHADDKQYTLIFKDTLLPRNPDDGREQSTISYEYDFRSRELGSSEIRRTLQIPWSSLKATYRGRVQEDAPAIHLQDIKRISLMMRSFFGTQQGDFSLTVESIAAVALAEGDAHTGTKTADSSTTLAGSLKAKDPELEHSQRLSPQPADSSIFNRMKEMCIVS